MMGFEHIEYITHIGGLKSLIFFLLAIAQGVYNDIPHREYIIIFDTNIHIYNYIYTE